MLSCFAFCARLSGSRSHAYREDFIPARFECRCGKLFRKSSLGGRLPAPLPGRRTRERVRGVFFSRSQTHPFTSTPIPLLVPERRACVYGCYCITFINLSSIDFAWKMICDGMWMASSSAPLYSNGMSVASGREMEMPSEALSRLTLNGKNLTSCFTFTPCLGR